MVRVHTFQEYHDLYLKMDVLKSSHRCQPEIEFFTYLELFLDATGSELRYF
jgi:hypothetical protein